MPIQKIEKKPEGEWIEVTGGDIFQFKNEGEEVVGKLVNIREGQYGNKVYDIETDNGTVSVFGTTIMDSRITEKILGKTIRIVFKGWLKGATGRKYKDFEIDCENSFA